MGLNPINVGEMDGVGLHLVVGNRGAGKGNVAMRKLTNWMLHTDRILVTNLAVKIDPWERSGVKQRGWQGKLIEDYNYEGPHLADRTWFIPKDDLEGMQFWWHIRGFGWEIPWISKEDWKKGRRLDIRFAYKWAETTEAVTRREEFREMSLQAIEAAVEKGELLKKRTKDLPRVVHAIDEMVALYPADDYTGLHPEVTYAITQMRKFPGGDQWYVFGTDGSLILKRFRSQVDDTLVLENLAKQQKFCFRLPSKVKAAKYHKFPESERAKPMKAGIWELRAEDWGQTYDTSAGIGEGFDGGGDADIGEHKPGIHIAWALLALPVIILVVINARSVFNWVSGKVLGKGGGPSVVAVSAAAPTNAPVGIVASIREGSKDMLGGGKSSSKEKVSDGLNDKEQKEEKRLTGVFGPVGGVMFLYWSDGSESSSGEREFQGVIRQGRMIRGVKWDGRVYHLGHLPGKS